MSLNCGKFNVPPFWLMESLSAPQTTVARCVSAASSQRPPVALPSVLRFLSRAAATVDVCVIVLRLFCRRRRRRRRNNNQISIHVRLVWFWFLGSLHENFRRSSACNFFVFCFFFGNFSSCCFSCLVSPSLRCAALHLKRPRSAQRAVCRVAPVPYSIPFRQLPPLIFNIKSYF